MSPDRLLTLLLLTHAVPWAPPGGRWESPPAAPAPGCLEASLPDDEVLRAVTIEIGGEARSITGVRISGLRTLSAAEVWRAVGEPPTPVDARTVAALVRRLVGLRVFTRVAPMVRVAGREVTVDIAVTEQPRVTRVVFEGLTEVRPERLLEPLLRAPEPRRPWPEHQGECPEPVVPPAWLARRDGDAVRPGLLSDGPRAALSRVLEALYDQGYEMASLTAALADDGVLTVRVDEGRLDAVAVWGVAPGLEPEVRARLDLPLGRPLQVGDVEQGLRRVQAAFPFLRPARGRRPARSAPLIRQEGDGLRFRAVDEPRPASGDGEDDQDGDDEDHPGRGYFVDGHRLVVTLRARRFDAEADPTELVRHTPATGWAPGLVGTARLWDPRNEIHLGLDLGGNINTNRAARPPVDPAVPPERWRTDWLVGGRAQLPRVHITEIGVQGYSRVDTSDRWRIDRLDSYLYSLLFNRPATDYYHREGLTAFLTAQWFERLVAGLEYRHDRYRSLASVDRYYTVFYRHEPPVLMPPITEGDLRTVLLRLEYSTQPTPAHEVRGVWRDPERGLASGSGHLRGAELRTVNTLEIADPALLGGEPGIEFVRLVSDTVIEEPVREHHRIKVRFRAAGRLGEGTLPVQKEEALGGWIALRGYDFKELGGGDFSLLGTVEYRYHAVSVFFDGGQVRRAGAFGAVRVSSGLALNLGPSAHLDVAWRLDDRARLVPLARFFFRRAF